MPVINNAFHELPDHLPGVEPVKIQYITYSRYTFDADDRLKIYSDIASLRWDLSKTPMSIGDFVNSVLAGEIPDGGSPAPQRYQPPNACSTLDIVASEYSYVVIQLDNALSWRFSCKSAALSSVKDYGFEYVQLRHIGPDGALLPSTAGANCQLIVFSALGRSKERDEAEGYARHFNVHVEIDQPGYWPGTSKRYDPIQLIIDPDIPNDGGSIPLEDI